MKKSLSIKKTRKWFWYTPKLVCDQEAVTVERNQGVYTDREVMTNKSDIIIACTTAQQP